ncbi:iron-sulfur cluster assembly factor IBA57, mitochondrial-like [Tubulanus polymorphus]|uniref:iron-sulfur cluster assembly factor IBA57, mitochondrial-like n=1 Tax=Tubulanus polymorphus TaxID=672921 RepID=UPI003DA327A5
MKMFSSHLRVCLRRINIRCNSSSNGIKFSSTAAAAAADSGKIMNSSQLKSRGLIKLTGNDTESFLQGLITNDLKCFTQHQCHSLYTMMLNVQGRILYDFLMYNISEQNSTDVNDILIECDSSAVTEVIATLKRYKIRKKVDISDVSDSLKVWTIFPNKIPESSENLKDLDIVDESKATVISADPRLKSIGFRCLLPENTHISQVVKDTKIEENEDLYRIHRYQLGIAEGVSDFHPGKSLPLESNLVFLNGVNFNKGCYIGQELTARTHHTGVTRKRIMPLFLDGNSDGLEFDDSIKIENGKGAGKYRNGLQNSAIGLIRLSDVNKNLAIEKKDGATVKIRATVPFWWPDDVTAPKTN